MKPRAASRAPISGVDFGTYLRAEASLSDAPEQAGALAQELGLADEVALREVVRAWQLRVSTEPALEAAYALYRDGAKPVPLAVEPGSSDAPVAESSPSLPVRVAVPSYLQATGQPASSGQGREGSSDRPSDADVTLPPLRRRVGSTLPFARDQDVPDAVRAAWAEEKAKRDETVDEVPPKSGGDETAFLPRRLFDAPATPFEKNDVQARPASPRSFKTEALDLASLQRPSTPFSPPSSGATPASSSAPLASPDSSPLDITQPPLRLIAAAAAQPFRALDPTEPPNIGIERYAAVSAALARDEPQEQVLARFGLTRDDWIAEMRRMSERFSAEPRLRAQYQELVRRALGQAV